MFLKGYRRKAQVSETHDRAWKSGLVGPGEEGQGRLPREGDISAEPWSWSHKFTRPQLAVRGLLG